MIRSLFVFIFKNKKAHNLRVVCSQKKQVQRFMRLLNHIRLLMNNTQNIQVHLQLMAQG